MNVPDPADIRNDPFIRGLLSRLPTELRDSFSDDQLLGLKIALGARRWKLHPVDLRGTISLWRWRFYYVILLGRERRRLPRRIERAMRWTEAVFLGVLVTVATLFGLLVLYLVKSALGIDLIPGFSLGIWGWFKAEFGIGG
ncbi:hypothetical protein MIN45_P0133 [Methylomarinovum tepidoasis]|uniref:3-phosphoshikimate 1-carboxyvinyltransferase n=1 Tax=Methylomarinovum tepidoasis TaxID=2840183 RepID=A0AAU9CAS6_9GAMM|nr:hypothetical protein [Methylomarinovum sp. IN45]BCX87766.1 hypothetical protein MIN45_P0133 [Methylomarinovum sp. IN45]